MAKATCQSIMEEGNMDKVDHEPCYGKTPILC